MAYSAIADVLNAAGGTAALLALSDLENTGATDPTAPPCSPVITAAITAADGLIDTYLNKRFQVPLPIVTPHVQRLSARLAVFELRDARGQLSSADLERHELDITWLTEARDGKQVPGLEPLPPASSMEIEGAGVRPASKLVSRNRLKGYW